ncbi:MFS general substrate transporter [Thozetella sp. PMI_491]|nr:MFS general substrate transporter [Thozetella sp. PMI_491]
MAATSSSTSLDEPIEVEKAAQEALEEPNGNEVGLENEDPTLKKREEEGFMNAAAVVSDTIDDAESLAPEPAAEPQGILSGAIGRVVSRTSAKSWNPGPPPDGGWQAWAQAFYGHLVIMNTWGYINSFGVFQTYYATTLNHPPSDISWIGSIQIFLIYFVGAITGRLTDAGYLHHLIFLGTVFQIVGLFTTSVATEYWQLFLSQGICMGLGNGFLFCPSLAVLSTYFSKRRSLALGSAAAGGATGGLVFPSIARQLLPTLGFAWTMRTIGFIQLATLAVVNIGIRTRLPPRKTGPFLELSAFKELEYTFYACGSFFSCWSVYIAFYYLASFSRDVIGMSYTDSLNLLLVLNGGGAIGRLVPNHIADKVGPINVFVPTAAIAGICLFCWMAVSNVAGLYVWAVFYGIAAGGIQSLFPAGLSSLTTDLRKAGVRLGMVFTLTSFATLTGPPLAGALITAADGKYYGAQAFAGAALIIGSGFMVAARVVRSRKVKGSGSILRVKV